MSIGTSCVVCARGTFLLTRGVTEKCPRHASNRVWRLLPKASERYGKDPVVELCRESARVNDCVGLPARRVVVVVRRPTDCLSVYAQIAHDKRFEELAQGWQVAQKMT